MIVQEPREVEAIKDAVQGTLENSARLIKVLAVVGAISMILFLRKK